MGKRGPKPGSTRAPSFGPYERVRLVSDQYWFLEQNARGTVIRQAEDMVLVDWDGHGPAWASRRDCVKENAGEGEE